MKSYFIRLGILILLILLQTTLLNLIAIKNIVPDIAFIFLLICSFEEGCGLGQNLGFISGLSEDFISLSPPGFHALIKSLSAYIAGLFKRNLLQFSFLTVILLTAVMTFFKTGMSFILINIFNLPLSLDSFFNYKIMIEIIYNSVLSFPVYFLYKKVDTKIFSQKSKRHL